MHSNSPHRFQLTRVAALTMVVAAASFPCIARAGGESEVLFTVGPFTETRTPTAISGPQAVTLRLTPEGGYKIVKSDVKMNDGVLWERHGEHSFRAAVVYSSKEFVHVDGKVVEIETGSGEGSGEPDPFHVTIPAVDLDWENEGHDGKAITEETEDSSFAWINDQTNGSFIVNAPLEGRDDMYLWTEGFDKYPDMQLSWDASKIDVIADEKVIGAGSLFIPRTTWGASANPKEMKFKVSRNINSTEYGDMVAITLTRLGNGKSGGVNVFSNGNVAGANVAAAAASGSAYDVIKAKPVVIDLKIADVSEEDEETIGGFVMVNADNDNGSEVTDFIPAKRDFDATNYKDDDLMPLQISKGNAPENSSFTLKAVESGRDRIRIWRDSGKTKKLDLPATLSLPIDNSLFIEGIKEGKAMREVSLLLECVHNNKVIATDSIKLTVTPVLTGLSAAIIGGRTYPELIEHTDNGLYYFMCQDIALEAKAFSGIKPNGKIALIQLVKNSNHLTNGAGFLTSSGVAMKNDHKDQQFRGMSLVDIPDSSTLPFYEKGDSNYVLSSDCPSILLSTELIQKLNSNDENSWANIDVSFDFDLYAVWIFSSENMETIYVLGKTDWNVRFAGQMFRFDDMPGISYVYEKNKIFCNDKFERINGNIRTQGPSANSQTGNTWISQ